MFKRLVFGSKEFESGLTVNFKLFLFNGLQVQERVGTEIADTGIYYAIFWVNPFIDYVCIAEESLSGWKAFQYVEKVEKS